MVNKIQHYEWRTALTLLLSFIPRDASFFDLSGDAQHHGDCQQICHLDDKTLLWERINRSESGVNTLRLKGKWLEGFFFFFYSLWTPCQHSWSPFSPALTQSRRTGSWSHAWSVWWFLSAKLGRLGGNRPYWSAGPGTPSPRTADTQEDMCLRK